MDIDSAGSRTPHFGRRVPESPDFSPELRGKETKRNESNQSDSTVSIQSKSKEKSLDLGSVEGFEVRVQRREKERRGERKWGGGGGGRGGTEKRRENNEWNINRFASVYYGSVHVSASRRMILFCQAPQIKQSANNSPIHLSLFSA